VRLYIGLVHFPVYDKNRRRIASAITTVDLHDISRVARTYAVKGFFVITPLCDQQMLAERIRSHWTEGFGARYNEYRKEAIRLVEIVPSLERAIHTIKQREGEPPLTIATDASRQDDRRISYAHARCMVRDERTIILVFGTAWGLDQRVLKQADYVLDPISGTTDYNHLSVRSAAAIILDRLAGQQKMLVD
jgi:hypothetical protein